MWKKTTVLLLGITVVGWFLIQAATIENDKFLREKELIKIVEVARYAGFSEEEISKMTIDGDGRSINLLEYLENFGKPTVKVDSLSDYRLPKNTLTTAEILRDLQRSNDKELASVVKRYDN